ncbi:MAG: SDR family oxidoreductase [Burkholderiales bacterium]|nr:SDR family oxidoreductase [Burkholderiales bacterium]
MPGVARRPIALITGASAGIGAALAERFAQGGHDLVLVARSTDKLHALAARLAKAYGVRSRVEPADLAEPGAASRLAARLKRARCAIDVLVNNAGVLEQGAFTAITPARHQQLIDLNVSGLTAMLAAFVPPMVARGQGRVLNVASIAAFQPVPALATYAATKAYVLSLSESLAEELRPSGVSVTALCPGITATDMLAKAAGANDKLRRVPAFVVGRVEDVAEDGYAACMKGTAICVPGLLNRAGTLASRATPKWLLRRVSGALARKAM